MIIKHIQFKTLLCLVTPLVIACIPNASHAQEVAEKKTIAPDSSELLKKGNTWTYAVSIQIPEDVKFESKLKDKGKKTKTGMIFKYEQIQQSTGLTEVAALERLAPQINIFIEANLTKKQILEYRDGALLYYGTYNHDPKNPDSKKGMISVNPILLYNEGSKVADKWSWAATGLPDFQFRVTAKETEVEVQGTKYVVDKVQMDQVKKGSKHIIQSKEIWFAKGVGIVKEREKSYIRDGKAIIKTLELKSFKNRPIIEK